MLKTYKKKLVNGKEAVDLDDLEDEVSGLLNIIRAKKERMRPLHTVAQKPEAEIMPRRENTKAATASEVDQLAVLLEKASMSDSPTPTTSTSQ